MSELEKHFDPSECIRGIQQLLVSDKKKIAFLFGAGTSLAKKEANSPYVPAVGKMTELVVENLKNDVENGEIFIKAIDEIKVELELQSYGFNIETLLSNVEEKINIIGGGTLNNLKKNDFIKMDSSIRAKIQELVSVHNIIDPSKVASLIQYDFAKWICNAERRSAVEIFTTNYDYLFEIGLEAVDVPYYDGFTGSYMPFFNPDSLENMDYLPKQTKLWKIHGSLGLHEDCRGKTKKIIRRNSDKDDLLIYPSALKYNNCQKQPYAAFMDRLNAFLKLDDAVLFVCGYSFNDNHINERIISALNSNTTAHVFVFYYDIGWRILEEGGEEEVKECSFSIEDALAKIAMKNRKMSVLATKSAVIGGKFGHWSLKRKPDCKDVFNIGTYFIEENSNPWSGKGELILPDFSKFTAFLKNMIPKNEWEADEHE